MKNPHLTKQIDRNPATRPLFNFSTQFNEKTLNIAPLNVRACGSRKDQFNDSLVLAFHLITVSVSGTERIQDC